MTWQNMSNASSISHLPKLLPNGIYRSILSAVCSQMFKACSRLGRRASMSLFVFLLDSCGRIMQSCLRAAVLTLDIDAERARITRPPGSATVCARIPTASALASNVFGNASSSLSIGNPPILRLARST